MFLLIHLTDFLGLQLIEPSCFLQLKFLMKLLADVEPSLWPEYFLVYDNICHVDQLKLLRDPLPMEDPFSMIWLSVTKAIDDLHDRGE